MHLRKTVLVTIPMQTASLVLSMAVILLVSRWLGPAGKGLHWLLFTGAQLATVVLGFGFPPMIPAIVAADKTRAPGLIRNQAMVLGAGLCAFLAAMVINRWVRFYPELFGYEPVLLLFVAGGLGQAAFASLNLSLGDPWRYNMSTIITYGTSLVGVIVLRATNSLDVTSTLSAQAAGLLLASLYSLEGMRRDPAARRTTRSPRVPWRQHAPIAGLAFISTVVTLLMLRGDSFLLAKLTNDLGIVGRYSIAVFAAEMCLKIPQWSASILSPVVAADRERAAERTVQLFWLSIAIAALLFLVLLATRPIFETVVARVLGPGFFGLYPILLAIFPRVLLQSGGAILAGNLAGKGYTRYHPAACVSGTLAIFAFDWVFIRSYGAIGAGIGSSLGYTICLAVLYLGFLRHNALDSSSFLALSRATLRRMAWRTT